MCHNTGERGVRAGLAGAGADAAEHVWPTTLSGGCNVYTAVTVEHTAFSIGIAAVRGRGQPLTAAVAFSIGIAAVSRDAPDVVNLAHDVEEERVHVVVERFVVEEELRQEACARGKCLSWATGVPVSQPFHSRFTF